MRCIKRVRDLRHQADGALRLEAPVPPKQAPKIHAVDVLHREKEETLMLAGRDSRDDVRVIEARGDS